MKQAKQRKTKQSITKQKSNYDKQETIQFMTLVAADFDDDGRAPGPHALADSATDPVVETATPLAVDESAAARITVEDEVPEMRIAVGPRTVEGVGPQGVGAPQLVGGRDQHGLR